MSCLQISKEKVESVVAEKLNEALKHDMNPVEIAVLAKDVTESIDAARDKLEILQLKKVPDFMSPAESEVLQVAVTVFSLCIEAEKHPERPYKPRSLSDVADDFCEVYKKVRQAVIDSRYPKAV